MSQGINCYKINVYMTQPFKLLTLMAIQSPWDFHNVLSVMVDQAPKRKKCIFPLSTWGQSHEHSTPHRHAKHIYGCIKPSCDLPLWLNQWCRKTADTYCFVLNFVPVSLWR